MVDYPLYELWFRSRAYLAATYEEATEEELRQVKHDLKRYRGLDAEGMIWIASRLKEGRIKTKKEKFEHHLKPKQKNRI